MAAAKLSDEAFLAILEANPGLRERFVSIALAIADSEGNLKEADAIEQGNESRLTKSRSTSANGFLQLNPNANRLGLRAASFCFSGPKGIRGGHR